MPTTANNTQHSTFSTLVSSLTHPISTAVDYIHPSNPLRVPSFLVNDIHHIRDQLKDGEISFSIADLPAYIDAVRHLGNGGINDRLFLLEKLVTLISHLPENSIFARRLGIVLVDTLYKDLPHPPISYLNHFPLSISNNESGAENDFTTNGIRLSFAHRTSSGAYTALYMPTLGMAGTPYARSVGGSRFSSGSGGGRGGGWTLPDPAAVFDALLRRRDERDDDDEDEDWSDDGDRSGMRRVCGGQSDSENETKTKCEAGKGNGQLLEHVMSDEKKQPVKPPGNGAGSIKLGSVGSSQEHLYENLSNAGKNVASNMNNSSFTVEKGPGNGGGGMKGTGNGTGGLPLPSRPHEQQFEHADKDATSDNNPPTSLGAGSMPSPGMGDGDQDNRKRNVIPQMRSTMNSNSSGLTTTKSISTPPLALITSPTYISKTPSVPSSRSNSSINTATPTSGTNTTPMSSVIGSSISMSGAAEKMDTKYLSTSSSYIDANANVNIRQSRTESSLHTHSRSNSKTSLLHSESTPRSKSVFQSQSRPKISSSETQSQSQYASSQPDFVPHPSGLSSLFFAFADIIIHSLFNSSSSSQSSHTNSTSSYLDLSPLYGNTPSQTHKLRLLDGSGKIWDDTWSDKRICYMPPAVGALLCLFGRMHNFIADKLVEINESGEYIDPPFFATSSSTSTSNLSKLKSKLSKSQIQTEKHEREMQKMHQDESIFSRARLINCGFFMQIVLRDYVGAILGLSRNGLGWRVDALSDFRDSVSPLVLSTPTPRGEGNACSVEFNLMYRWHACLSEADEKWFGALMKDVVEKTRNKRGVMDVNDDIAPSEFESIAKMLTGEGGGDDDPRKWSLRVLPNFQPLQRDSKTNRFPSHELAKILQDATDSPAGAFRARGVSKAMRAVEILGMQMARGWGVCGLNEFRAFVGLKPYKDFKEWNPDPEIYKAAQSLYTHIDNLELYPGLHAEETKPPMPGAGLCPGFTISRAILADAVALSRGDRFLTTEFNSFNYTKWGYQECTPPCLILSSSSSSSDENSTKGNLSAISSSSSANNFMTRLLLHVLPEYYSYNSIYAHFPFYTTKKMRETFYALSTDSDMLSGSDRGLSLIRKYNFSRPEISGLCIEQGIDSEIIVRGFEGVREVLYFDHGRVMKGSERVFESLVVERGKMLFFDDVDGGYVWNASSKYGLKYAKFISETLSLPNRLPTYEKYFLEMTEKLIHERAFNQGTGASGNGSKAMYVDIVKDVINIVPIRFLCTYLVGIQIKSAENPNGLFEEKELYDIFADVSNYMFVATDPFELFILREKCTKAADIFIALIEDRFDKMSNAFLSLIPSVFTGMKDRCYTFLQSLFSCIPAADHSAFTARDIARNLFMTIIASATMYSKMLVNVVDYYLDDEREECDRRERNFCTSKVDFVQLLKRPSGQVAGHVGDYIAEALRYNPPISVALRTAKTFAHLVDGRTVHPGDKIYCGVKLANRDPIFEDMRHSPPSRDDFGPLGFFGVEPIGLLSPLFFQTTAPQVMRAVFGLKNLRRAAGASGQLRPITQTTHDLPESVYMNFMGQLTPWPNSLHLQYDV